MPTPGKRGHVSAGKLSTGNSGQQPPKRPAILLPSSVKICADPWPFSCLIFSHGWTRINTDGPHWGKAFTEADPVFFFLETPAEVLE